ncbi:ABC transporter ATP-binding protein [Hyphobacterium marinum]|uniref:ABC transporter ATP-binding protein n=1 Tax=Hyphobacterium marinum TaxID=3116574 RepID=A0ABU7LZI1_9PROT|nr:ABC transporter ATP-binding protein [Hyphobacterium sp. Y6023]MEE2566851.1 ABC transporter ATP-binding protein [Hyphobacterium sp. Y6023]
MTSRVAQRPDIRATLHRLFGWLRPAAEPARPACSEALHIRIDQLSRHYRSGRDRVTALTLAGTMSFRSGEVTVIAGRSGSGKSTLLNILGALDSPSGGEFQIDGGCCLSLSSWGKAQVRRNNIAFLFQDGGLIERMSVLDNVLLPLRFCSDRHANAVERARAAIEAVELGGKANRLVHCLSGGERHRVGLARALAREARLLICDEPTAALDATTSELVLRLLRKEAERGACVIVASHDPILLKASHFATRTITFEGGRVQSIEGG